MSKEIEVKVTQEVEINTQHIKATPYGLVIEGQPSPAEWYDVMLKVQGGELLMQWYKADLAACAESLTLGWGESKYDELSYRFDNDQATLKVFASVARRFPTSFRKKLVDRTINVFSLSFSHFRLVQGMSDEYAEYWLVKAADNQWGRDKFRAEILRDREAKTIDAEDEDGENIPTFNQVTKEMAIWARNYAKENEADLVRVQVIKAGKVIDEKTTEVY